MKGPGFVQAPDGEIKGGEAEKAKSVSHPTSACLNPFVGVVPTNRSWINNDLIACVYVGDTTWAPLEMLEGEGRWQEVRG